MPVRVELDTSGAAVVATAPVDAALRCSVASSGRKTEGEKIRG